MTELGVRRTEVLALPEQPHLNDRCALNLTPRHCLLLRLQYPYQHPLKLKRISQNPSVLLKVLRTRNLFPDSPTILLYLPVQERLVHTLTNLPVPQTLQLLIRMVFRTRIPPLLLPIHRRSLVPHLTPCINHIPTLTARHMYLGVPVPRPLIICMLLALCKHPFQFCTPNLQLIQPVLKRLREFHLLLWSHDHHRPVNPML